MGALTFVPLLPVHSHVLDEDASGDSTGKSVIVEPVITNEFTTKTHPGIDLMYPRKGTISDPPIDKGNGVKFIMFPGTKAHAAGNGKVVYAELRSKGNAVKIDHGGFFTYYFHLASLDIAPNINVVAGQELGLVGADPSDNEGLIHLHWAISDINNNWLDPTPAWKALSSGNSWAPNLDALVASAKNPLKSKSGGISFGAGLGMFVGGVGFIWAMRKAIKHA